MEIFQGQGEMYIAFNSTQIIIACANLFSTTYIGVKISGIGFDRLR